MYRNSPQLSLVLVNELVAEGRLAFTFDEIERRLGKSKTATANLLNRMEKLGLIDRVRRAHYVVRQLGVLGTPAAAEDIALSVGAALKNVPHRIAYRSALYEHDMLVHPARTIQVAVERRIRTKTLSGWPLKVVVESPERLEVGRMPFGMSFISDRHRAILDAAQRPRLVGGLEVLAQALNIAARQLDANILMDYARELGWAAALRRLGSLADTLALKPLDGALQPIKPINTDLDLEPGIHEPTIWRDSRWRVRSSTSVDELLAVIRY